MHSEIESHGTVTAEQYLDWVLGLIGKTEVVEMSLPDAFGMVLAKPVTARYGLPLWDSSAMDGYAIRASEVAAARMDAPVVLQISGEVSAGDSFDPHLPTGSAIRIMTGAPVPSDADTVVAIERVATSGSENAWDAPEISLTEPVAVGSNIRRQGEDIQQSELIASAGDPLNASRLSALAAVGIDTVSVYQSPRIAVLSTGSELRRSGSSLRRGEIPESNSVLLLGLLQEAGFAAITLEHFGDQPNEVKSRLAELAAEHDIVITTGGIGPGKFDVVRIALADEPDIINTRVKIRPGQPQSAGRHQAGAFIFGLPGNPVSAAVSFELFVRPALRKLAGFRRFQKRIRIATATVGWLSKLGSLQVLPVRLEEVNGELRCSPAVPPTRVSHSVASFGSSDGYALVEVDRSEVHAGEQVRVIETGLR